MCGILGHLALRADAALGKDRLLALNELMLHRGPSSAGHFIEGPMAMAMRRLAIIDLAGGDQPIFSPDERYVIVYNGEIYNYPEIRRELEVRGHAFRTSTDTEVLLHAFIEWGPASLSRCNGMFAAAIWDRRTQALFLARDRLGVKPLYFAADSRRLMFASELTPIESSGLFDLTVDIRSVADLLAYWYICEPKTIYRQVSQLPPGHYAWIKDGKIDMVRWWRLPADPPRAISYPEAQEELDALLRDSVALRLRSDVPVGTLLSGGIDSGIVTAITRQVTRQPVQSFSIGFKEKSYSELELAERTAQRVGVEFIHDTMGDFSADLIDHVLSSIDEPLGNASLIPSYLLFRLAKQHVRVVLTGDGGDELFGGYPTYQAPFYRRIFNLIPLPLRPLVRHAVHSLPVSHRRISLDYRLKRFVDGVSLPIDRAHAHWRELMNVRQQIELLSPAARELIADYDPFESIRESFAASSTMPEINRLMYADVHSYLLNDHLRKVDRMSMLNSVEARVPLLDFRIAEFAMSLPPEHKVTFRRTKRILKDVARPYLPRAVMRGAKKGLTPPISMWVSRDLTDYVRDQLQGPLLSELFDPAGLQRLLAEHLDKRRDHSRVIWALISLQAWSRRPGRTARLLPTQAAPRHA